MKTIVITGASGVVGSALLPYLDDFDVVCLAHRRRDLGTRAKWIRGDLTRSRLGLSLQDYRQLARRADAVLHCAAVTDFTADDTAMCALNIRGTDAMLEFARLADAPLYYVSTAFVARERFARGATGPAHYIASKRVAEAHVRASGVPAAVIRPSVVIGDSSTGEITRFQGLHALAGAFLRNALPIVPLPGQARLDFIPQDVVGACIAGLISKELAQGEWWLTAGPEAVPLTRVLDRCSQLGRELGLDLARPRLMPADVVDRLIRPVFIESLHPNVRSRFDQLLDMAALFEDEQPFESSLPALGRTMSTVQLEDAFARSMRFWAESKGVGTASRLAA